MLTNMQPHSVNMFMKTDLDVRELMIYYKNAIYSQSKQSKIRITGPETLSLFTVTWKKRPCYVGQ